MYLKSLELLGFKSFAAKTTLQFHRGVTAIVGPNGCGKSNVLDALRWVLGEQSPKALRGGEMADVIFGGTDSRPPLGMAEVSMTFAECEKQLGVEWNEVRITRRLFRDGKSEYMLNKTPCRLKDIQQLFMDTGIGRSAYSIMEQGKIDLILSSKPEDRRAIFEEAAGITRYKAQKKEALRKLEHTEANLLRVSDIIKEVKRQIGSLQRQAAKARRYQALTQDLQTFETHLSHRNYSTLLAEDQEIEENLRKYESEVYEKETQVTEQDAMLASVRANLDELDRMVSERKDAAQAIRNRIFSAESRIQTNTERAGEFQEMIERYRSDIAAARAKVDEQIQQIQSTEQRLAEVTEALRLSEAMLSEHHARVQSAREERVRLEQQLREDAAGVTALEQETVRLHQEIASARSKREASEARMAMLQGELASSASTIEDLQAKISDIGLRILSAESALTQAKEALTLAQSAQDEAQSRRQQADAEVNNVARALAERQSRLDVLRQLSDQGEGFSEGTQALLRGLDNPELFKGSMAGPLAEHLEVAPEYIPAVEAALGNALQAVLFKDGSVAEAAVLALRDKKLGRASLLPRDWQRRKPEYFHVLQAPEGALGWAKDFVRAGEDVAGFVEALLHDVVVVDTLENAFRLKSQYPALAFATLSGEWISREGVVTGGQSSGSPSSSALLRKAQIATLEAEIDSLEAQHNEAQTRRAHAYEEFEMAQARLHEAREALQSAQVNHSSLRNEETLLNRQLQEACSWREGLESEFEQIQATLEEASGHASGLEQRLEESNAQLSSRRAALSELESRIAGAREMEQALSAELNDLRLRAATERQNSETLSRSCEPMQARLAELHELIAQREQDIASYEQRIVAVREEETRLRESIGEWNVELQQAEGEIEAAAAERTAAAARVHEIDAALRDLRRELSEAQERRGRLEVRRTQVQLRMENIREHVQRRYQLDIAEFRPDTYALICALRDREKKASRGQTGENGEQASEVAVSAAVEASTAAEESSSQESEVAAPVVQEAPEASQAIPWDRIEALVRELGEKLDSMGPVNLDAIQEYDELEERHKFLEQQFTDLENAKAELLEVIARINKTTRELFTETFEKIRVNFQEMFSELFGGGKANLVLSDESDPLECGIEIIAKPPGKQLQSVSLLSGGERTMAAVSLLFAIYMVKPSPFCVLDEMDAPLDESNINRFVKILDRFVDQSQFVVITHNKRTIARADMLYGVTMEEHGVSKIVSVKFRQKDETAASAGGNGREYTPSVAESFGKRGDLRSEIQEQEETTAPVLQEETTE